MLIGLVGKPSCGKSTFFKAATMADVLIASYPFATIKPNHGVGHVKIDCIDKEFDTNCNPQKGYCINHKRFIPIEIMDVAGLVEGASEGKGLGNQFLDNLTSADAFIHIVDVSGETDEEGKETKNYDPTKDVKMLENELDLWYLGILKKVWGAFARTVQNTKSDFAKAVAKQFSGLKVTEDDIKDVLRSGDFNIEKPNNWTDQELKKFAHKLRHLTKPMIIAANKIDKPNSKENLEKLKTSYPDITIMPCSADSELALREASKAKLIEYVPGDKDFKETEKLNEKQKGALNNIKDSVLTPYKSTGVQEILNYTVFNLLKYIAIFPASANRLADSKGNILPDCFLLPEKSTALDFAYYLHTDFGKNFIKAIDARTKQAVGKDYQLKDRDALEIMTR
jgi:ribosome-binding ATPase YchF (GTP1/OBG family)